MEIWLLVQLRLVSCLWLYKPVELGLTAWVKLDCKVTLGGDERECDVISFILFFFADGGSEEVLSFFLEAI